LSQTTEAQVLNSPRERLVKWLRDFVGEFRIQYSSLTSDEQPFVQKLDNFSKPCQIDVIWSRPPDVQNLIVTTFEDRPDLEIYVNGPFPTYEAVERLESILQESRWNRPVPQHDVKNTFTEDKTFRDIVDRCFVDIVRGMRVLPYQKPFAKVSTGSKMLLTNQAFFWTIQGDLSNLKSFELAREIIDGAKTQARAPKSVPRNITIPDPKMVQACGSFIFPPVWIGSEPKPSFRERALGGFVRFPPKAFEGSYKDRMIVATDDGFIAISEADREKATALLNEIMAVRLLEGKATFSFREQEVEGATIDPDTKEIRSMGVPSLSIRATLIEERWNPARLPVYVRRDVISLDDFKAWISRAEMVTQNVDIADSLRFLLEAYTHFQDSRYKESFVLSWVVVEKHLYSLWKRLLKEEGLPRPRRDKLGNTNYWTVDFVIESLSLLKQISSAQYGKLISMKGLRNDIIHEGETVSKEQAQQVLEEATRIVTDTIGADPMNSAKE